MTRRRVNAFGMTRRGRNAFGMTRRGRNAFGMTRRGLVAAAPLAQRKERMRSSPHPAAVHQTAALDCSSPLWEAKKADTP